MKYYFDMQDQFDKGMEEGEAKGRAEGRAKGLAEGKVQGIAEAEAKVVKTMYADHVPVDKIAKYVSLTETEIQTILTAK